MQLGPVTAQLSGPGLHNVPGRNSLSPGPPPCPRHSPQAGDAGGMPVPPKRLKDLIEGAVGHHASQTRLDPQEVTIR